MQLTPDRAFQRRMCLRDSDDTSCEWPRERNHHELFLSHLESYRPSGVKIPEQDIAVVSRTAMNRNRPPMPRGGTPPTSLRATNIKSGKCLTFSASECQATSVCCHLDVDTKKKPATRPGSEKKQESHRRCENTFMLCATHRHQLPSRRGSTVVFRKCATYCHRNPSRCPPCVPKHTATNQSETSSCALQQTPVEATPEPDSRTSFYDGNVTVHVPRDVVEEHCGCHEDGWYCPTQTSSAFSFRHEICSILTASDRTVEQKH